MIPAAEWWAMFRNYNATIFPLQPIIMVLLLALTFWKLLRGGTQNNRILLFSLGLCNLLNGILFFIVIGTTLPSPMRFFQGGLFILIGLLFLWEGLKNQTIIKLPEKKSAKIIFVALLILIYLYPIIGLLRGHTIFELVYPGTLPCATTSLSIVLLASSLSEKTKNNYLLYVALLMWAIPFAPLIQIPIFKVYEDIIMFICGIYGLVRLIRFILNKKSKNLASKA